MVNAETWAALAEYDSMFGPPVETVIYDWTIRGYRMCKLQPLRTPKDDPPPADPDKAIDKPVQLYRKPKPANIIAMNKARAERHAAIKARVVEYLTEYGPMTQSEMVRDLGIPYSTMRSHLKDFNKGTYHVVGKVVQAQVWGLAGVHDATS